MAGFNYQNAKLEKINCNLCGQDNFFVLARKSQGGLSVQTCLCQNCGLIYINPRMNKEEYDNYYRYFYRLDRANIKGKDILSRDPEVSFQKQKRFGTALAQKMAGYFKNGLTLDVGSSLGGILAGLKESLSKLEVMGLEPSVEESDFANSKGIKTQTCLFENFKPSEERFFSNIICIQTLNHLLDPRLFLEWCQKNLESDGHLILAVKNFRSQCYRAGRVSGAVQIDHTFMFTPETLKYFVESVGFEIIYFDVDEKKSRAELNEQRQIGLHRHHIRLVAKKIARSEQKLENRKVYQKLRLQLSWPMVKIYSLFNFIFYGGVKRFLSKIKHIFFPAQR